ncbi:MAG: hypothetical protein FWD37_03665, partial [Methanomassiliicoccaceae archaeon]|nr:hypothetical protein [Methanomassiliicoccaceae archaeon]
MTKKNVAILIVALALLMVPVLSMADNGLYDANNDNYYDGVLGVVPPEVPDGFNIDGSDFVKGKFYAKDGTGYDDLSTAVTGLYDHQWNEHGELYVDPIWCIDVGSAINDVLPAAVNKLIIYGEVELDIPTYAGSVVVAEAIAAPTDAIKGKLILLDDTVFAGSLKLEGTEIELNGAGTANFASVTVTVAGVSIIGPGKLSTGSLTVDSGASLLIDDDADLTITGTATINGTLTVSGTLTAATTATVDVNVGGTLDVGTGASLTLSGNATANISGTLVAGGTLSVNTGATVDVKAGGTLTINEDNTLAGTVSLSGSLTVADVKTLTIGTLTVPDLAASSISGPGDVEISGSMNVLGILNLNATGALTVNATGPAEISGELEVTGSLTVPTGKMLAVNTGGILTIKTDTTIAGTLAVSGEVTTSATKTLTINGSLTVPAAATAIISGTVNVYGALNMHAPNCVSTPGSSMMLFYPGSEFIVDGEFFLGGTNTLTGGVLEIRVTAGVLTGEVKNTGTLRVYDNPIITCGFVGNSRITEEYGSLIYFGSFGPGNYIYNSDGTLMREPGTAVLSLLDPNAPAVYAPGLYITFWIWTDNKYGGYLQYEFEKYNDGDPLQAGREPIKRPSGEEGTFKFCLTHPVKKLTFAQSYESYYYWGDVDPKPDPISGLQFPTLDVAWEKRPGDYNAKSLVAVGTINEIMEKEVDTRTVATGDRGVALILTPGASVAWTT